MKQHVDETWEQRVTEKLFPSLEVLFPDSVSHIPCMFTVAPSNRFAHDRKAAAIIFQSPPRLEPINTSRKPNANEASVRILILSLLS